MIICDASESLTTIKWDGRAQFDLGVIVLILHTTDVHLRPVELIIATLRSPFPLNCSSFARNLGRGASHISYSLHL